MLKFLSPVALDTILEEVAGTSGERAAEEGVALQIDLPAQLPEIIADRDRLVQVFLNLVDNAIRYTPRGGSVTVTARSSDGCILVSVCDTGSGIPAQHLPHLFERFYRVDPARTVKSGGTGLGLSIVDQVVRAHGGTIHVESEVGRGTCFNLQLPLQPPSVSTTE